MTRHVASFLNSQSGGGGVDSSKRSWQAKKSNSQNHENVYLYLYIFPAPFITCYVPTTVLSLICHCTMKTSFLSLNPNKSETPLTVSSLLFFDLWKTIIPENIVRGFNSWGNLKLPTCIPWLQAYKVLYGSKESFCKIHLIHFSFMATLATPYRVWTPDPGVIN